MTNYHQIIISDIHKYCKNDFGINYQIQFKTISQNEKLNIEKNNLFDDNENFDKYFKNFDEKVIEGFYLNDKYYKICKKNVKKYEFTRGIYNNTNYCFYRGDILKSLSKHDTIITHSQSSDNKDIKMFGCENIMREYVKQLLNIPNLKVYVLLPSNSLIEYSCNFPVSTWNYGCIFIKYYKNNIDRFYKLFDKKLFEKYNQGDCQLIYQGENYNTFTSHNGGNPHLFINMTYYQDDDEYWEGTKTLSQYDVTLLESDKRQYDSIVSILQEQLKSKNDEIAKINKMNEEQIEKLKKDYDLKFKAETEKIKEIYDETIKQISKNKEIKKDEPKINKQEDNNKVIKTLKTQLIELRTENQTLNETNDKLFTELSKIKNENKELQNNNERLIEENITLQRKLKKSKDMIDKYIEGDLDI